MEERRTVYDALGPHWQGSINERNNMNIFKYMV